MNLSLPIQHSIESLLSCKIIASKPLYGGDINQSVQLQTEKGTYFLKWNSKKSYPQMFEKEARGLESIANTKTIDTPKIIATGSTENEAYLLLSFIHSTANKKNFWELFGQQLANLHRNTAKQFGYNEDNYIGSLPQRNIKHNSFIDFFIHERLEAQLDMVEKSHKIESKHRKAFEALYKQLPNILPEEPPALLHGDLWSGNYMVNSLGKPCLIDPAVYYGHREIDLAMTTLFGRFDPIFYEAYNTTHPLEKDWQKRLPIYNLYPLLVHVNLFGGSYLREIEQILLTTTT